MNKTTKWLTALGLAIGIAASVKAYVIVPWRMDAADEKVSDLSVDIRTIKQDIVEIKLMLARIEERQKMQERRAAVR